MKTPTRLLPLWLRACLPSTRQRSHQNVLTRQTSHTLPDLLWAGLGTLLAPALIIMLHVRLKHGRELPNRLRERMGLDPTTRPPGPLLWMHAASVGETLCAHPLLDDLLSRDPTLTILFTTATITGADIISKHPQYGQRILHRFIPHDVPRWYTRFLNRWKPNGAVFVESELWPGLIATCHRRNIPVMVVNGRLSDTSARRWHKAGRLARSMFSRLTWVAARGTEDATHFRTLGTPTVHTDGDLKQDAPPLPYNPAELTRLRTLIGERPVFVAASTHPGEEEIILRAAEKARETLPSLLTILIPRHPARGTDLATRFNLPRRSTNQDPTPQTPVWLADTLGEIGLFYRLATCCFLGNSLPTKGKGGGHNPFEPLRLGIPTATGPLMQNWREAVALLQNRLNLVQDETDLTHWILQPHTPLSTTGLDRSVVSKLSPRILESLRS